jgi:hypothetical protein
MAIEIEKREVGKIRGFLPLIDKILSTHRIRSDENSQPY